MPDGSKLEQLGREIDRQRLKEEIRKAIQRGFSDPIYLIRMFSKADDPSRSREITSEIVVEVQHELAEAYKNYDPRMDVVGYLQTNNTLRELAYDLFDRGLKMIDAEEIGRQKTGAALTQSMLSFLKSLNLERIDFLRLIGIIKSDTGRAMGISAENVAAMSPDERRVLGAMVNALEQGGGVTFEAQQRDPNSESDAFTS